MLNRSGLAYWSGLATSWSIPPPLAPDEGDIAWYRSRAHEAARSGAGPLGAMLLGVTRRIAALDWPSDTSLVAVDWSESMLRNVWREDGLPRGAARVVGDWRQLPVADASRDLIVGDGCYTALGDLEGARLMNAEARRILRRRGLFCVRCFVRPERTLSIAQLLAELRDQPSGLDLFRWRFAMAVQGPQRWGVSLREVWRVWNETFPDRGALGERYGWTGAEIGRVERFRDAPANYAFPSLAQVRELAASQFEVVDCDIPAYAMGECFPRLALRARD